MKKSLKKQVKGNKSKKKAMKKTAKKAVTKRAKSKPLPKKVQKKSQAKAKLTQTTRSAKIVKTRDLALILHPSRDGILVERVEVHDRTPGGLYIPETAQQRPLKGVVVAAGPGQLNKRGKRKPTDVQPGDEVLFAKFAGTEVILDGKEYLLIREDEILGVVS